MTEDRSLEDFVGGATDPSEAETSEDEELDADADSDAVAADEGADADSAADADDAPEPAVATYRWDPEGVECDACGESVERVWTADADGSDEFVCESCKEW